MLPDISAGSLTQYVAWRRADSVFRTLGDFQTFIFFRNTQAFLILERWEGFSLNKVIIKRPFPDAQTPLVIRMGKVHPA
jgi:hypothetical protein